MKLDPFFQFWGLVDDSTMAKNIVMLTVLIIGINSCPAEPEFFASFRYSRGRVTLERDGKSKMVGNRATFKHHDFISTGAGRSAYIKYRGLSELWLAPNTKIQFISPGGIRLFRGGLRLTASFIEYQFVERSWRRSDFFDPLPIKIHCSEGIITVRCSYFISKGTAARAIIEVGGPGNPWLAILNANCGVDLNFPRFKDLKEVPLSSSCILQGTNIVERDFAKQAFADYSRSTFTAHFRHP
ncbi:MAG: hypothetical protein QGF00_35430 [Planctomycetota bacterium]|nr:hypothetical protein [Planctomycetota bacterium]MDP7254942.1 hypothetical protein [Planctomycetota bacterium]